MATWGTDWEGAPLAGRTTRCQNPTYHHLGRRSRNFTVRRELFLAHGGLRNQCKHDNDLYIVWHSDVTKIDTPDDN